MRQWKKINSIRSSLTQCQTLTIWLKVCGFIIKMNARPLEIILKQIKRDCLEFIISKIVQYHFSFITSLVKIVSQRGLCPKIVSRENFWTLFKIVSQRGLCPARSCPARSYCIFFYSILNCYWIGLLKSFAHFSKTSTMCAKPDSTACLFVKQAVSS